jgi:HD domain
MDPIYSLLRDRARRIVSRLPLPDFYADFHKTTDQARRLSETDPILARLRLFVAEHIEDDFGHGLEHAEKVTVDAGALMIIEGGRAGYPDALKTRQTLLVECAGLLHDIKRKHDNHAIAGADFAGQVLRAYPFSPAEIEDICTAIRNHEAFKDTVPVNTPEGVLISDCLYDADKFRWGPDNFYYTVWDMVSFFNIPLSEFMTRYPKGMKGLEEIKTTFRTKTGKKYGPQFIDMGIAIGEELYRIIKTEFSHLL